MDTTFGVVVGREGRLLIRNATGWSTETTGFESYQTLHGVWVDASGAAWAVGGNFAGELDDGILLRRAPGQ